MTTEQDDFSLLGGAGGGYNIGNFDPSNIQEDEVILSVLAVDISPSISGFEKDLNEAFKAFIEEMQQSHVAQKLMVKVIEFNEKVVEKSGFMPVASVDINTFRFKASGSSTALFDAAKLALDSVVSYRQQLESTGINVKVLVFVITDGQDNSSQHGQSKAIAAQLDDIAKEERNVFAFETILFGIGNDQTSFSNSQRDMHFKHLAVVGNTGKDIRKMIGFISASVSRSNSNQAIQF